jgi:Zn-dependent peptidase ImmA (M78 family)
MGLLMGDIFAESLYKKQNKQFEKINEQSKAFAANYCGNTIIRDSIFGIVSNYARKRELSLEVLRYPFKDNELWAFTFVKKGTIFLCVNSDLPLCKQIFATAHELYHIHCYAEDINTSTITDGSLLDSKTFDEEAASQEDLEANAFAGLLLMPDSSLTEQFKMFGLSGDKLDVDDVLILMDIFALPYKAVILRLGESGLITQGKAQELVIIDSTAVSDRIELTGRAKSWQQNSNHLLYYGSLLANLAFNSENELLTDTREASDKAYLEKIGKEFRKES